MRRREGHYLAMLPRSWCRRGVLRGGFQPRATTWSCTRTMASVCTIKNLTKGQSGRPPRTVANRHTTAPPGGGSTKGKRPSVQHLGRAAQSPKGARSRAKGGCFGAETTPRAVPPPSPSRLQLALSRPTGAGAAVVNRCPALLGTLRLDAVREGVSSPPAAALRPQRNPPMLTPGRATTATAGVEPSLAQGLPGAQGDGHSAVGTRGCWLGRANS